MSARRCSSSAADAAQGQYAHGSGGCHDHGLPRKFPHADCPFWFVLDSHRPAGSIASSTGPRPVGLRGSCNVIRDLIGAIDRLLEQFFQRSRSVSPGTTPARHDKVPLSRNFVDGVFSL